MPTPDPSNMTASAAILPLEQLAWDSEQFGISVAAITNSHLASNDLDQVLNLAGQRGTKLVYWASAVELPPESELLQKYHGLLADRKTTYSKALTASAQPSQECHRELREINPADESPALLELGIAAGLWSRFAIDPRFPPEKFRALYKTWMQRSIRRELAATVLVVEAPESNVPLGMVTISLHGNVGQIGLIAVAEQQRGRGIGRRLIEGADHWMQKHGAQSAKVVTQGANESACRLYEWSGYAVEKVEYMYHFWP